LYDPFVEKMMSNRLRDLFWQHRGSVALAAVLLLSSAAGLALLAFRYYYSGTAGYAFMPWNLFLAWLPLCFALAMTALRHASLKRAPMLGLGLLWLLFFPNAPYLLTEFVHLDPQYAVYERPVRALAQLSPHRDVPVWFDALLILTFAWNGLLLGFVSLHLVQHAVRERLGAAWGWATVVAVLCLSGFGVSLGRFERWNSWDLFSRPATLLADVAARVLNPIDHIRTTGVTLALSSFLLLAYLSLEALAAARPARYDRARP
jgi:uncharacterized membrane protein